MNRSAQAPSVDGAALDGRVVVMGGSGFIGRNVVRLLSAAGADVTIMDIAPAPDEFNNIAQVIGSVSDTSLLASTVADCTAVIFLSNSSLPGSANNDLSSEVFSHVQLTIKAAEVCNSQGVKRFIFASSGGTVYGYSSDVPLREDMPTIPRNAYGVSKLAIEHYLRLISMQYKMDCVSLRISNPYGEGQRAQRNQGFIAAAMRHAISGQVLPIWGDGSVERDFVHISDVARAFLDACCAKNPPNELNIGYGSAVSLLHVLRLIEMEFGKEIPVHFTPSRTIDVHRNVLDIHRAKETIGWSPRINLEDGLKQTAAWWKSVHLS